jgi:hypothetical protein
MRSLGKAQETPPATDWEAEARKRKLQIEAAY